MRSPRLLAPAGTLALLGAVLVSCGGQTGPVPGGPGEGARVVPASPLVAGGQIVSVRVRPGTTPADLESRYPSGRLLALHPDEGYAQLWVPGAAEVAPQPDAGGLSLNAQAVTVVASEPDAVLSTPAAQDDNDTDAQGNGIWAGGNGVWAGGFGAGQAQTAFTENLPAWAVIDVSGGQKLAPALGKGISVAVVDTGLDLGHPGLAGHLNVAAGWDYVDGDATPQDEGQGNASGHGTGVAGVILQVAPNATLIPFRVLNAGGQGKLSNVIAAVGDAVKGGARVINLSLGSVSASPALSAAISSAIRGGVMVVASSGNSGDGKVTYPARSSAEMQATLGGGLLSVGSETLTLKKSSFSTYGVLDLLAPGESVRTLYPGAQLTNATGTSFAAPMVSGAVALAMSSGRTNVVALSRNLKASASAPADPLFAGLLGSGSLNIGKLMVSK